MKSREPKWVEIDVVGKTTGERYVGSFLLKPFLKLGERADATRLAEKYYRGIYQSDLQRNFLTALAYVKFHILDIDERAKEWWLQDGLDLEDEEPVYEIADRVQEFKGAKEVETSDKSTKGTAGKPKSK